MNMPVDISNGVVLEVIDEIQLSALAALWNEPLIFVKQFAEALNSVTAGYFLSYFTDKCQPDEWVALNDYIIKNESGLSSKQWRPVAKRLRNAGILLNKRITYASLYSINEHKLNDLIKQHSDTHLLSMAQPMSLNRLHTYALLNLGLSFKACLLLAYMQQECAYIQIEERQEYSPFVLLSDDVIKQNLVLSNREVKSAINALELINIVHIDYRGFPRMRYGRFNLRELGIVASNFLKKGR